MQFTGCVLAVLMAIAFDNIKEKPCLIFSVNFGLPGPLGVTFLLSVFGNGLRNWQ
jgi:hypothetical protein